MLYEVITTTKESINKIYDIFIFVENSSEVVIEKWNQDSDSDRITSYNVCYTKLLRQLLAMSSMKITMTQ